MAKKKTKSSSKNLNKTGAIELSITTIIVIVVGIVLLGLGIAFVSGVFSDVESLTQDVFQGARASIDQIDIGGRFSVPSSIEVEEGSATTVDVIVGHDGSFSRSTATFNVQIAPAQGISQNSVTANLLSQASIQLDPGSQATFRVVVEASPNAITELQNVVPAFSVVVTADGKTYENSGFIVKVTKGRSLFG